jgi:hypothetical protein
MRTHILTASLVLVVPIAAGCARARAATTDSAAAPAAATFGVAGNCPGSTAMQPATAGTKADANGDGYVCSGLVRSPAGDTSRVTVDNDAASSGNAPVEANLYRRM